MTTTIDGTTGIITETGTGDVSVGDDLIFTGTGNRITGDFTNATAANRVAFQTSTTNGSTVVTAIPNGTSTTAQLEVFSNSDFTNGSNGVFRINNSELLINSGIRGTGTYLPMTFYTNASERMRIDTSGNLLIGTSTTRNKLTVAGTATATPTLGTAAGAALFSGTDLGYGTMFGTGGSGDGWIQQQRVDGTATAYNLLLQPSGGNVGIGTSSPSTKLHVSDTSTNTVRSRTQASTGYVDVAMVGNSGVFDTTASDGIRLRLSGNDAVSVDSSSNLRFNSGYGSVATAYGCRVWVNFNGTGTVAIRASGNVTSITDNGTGDYTVNFTTAMPDANYSMIGASSLPAGGSDRRVVATNLNTAPTTSAVRISVGYSATADDQTYVQVAIFR